MDMNMQSKIDSDQLTKPTNFIITKEQIDFLETQIENLTVGFVTNLSMVESTNITTIDKDILDDWKLVRDELLELKCVMICACQDQMVILKFITNPKYVSVSDRVPDKKQLCTFMSHMKINTLLKILQALFDASHECINLIEKLEHHNINHITLEAVNKMQLSIISCAKLISCLWLFALVACYDSEQIDFQFINLTIGNELSADYKDNEIDNEKLIHIAQQLAGVIDHISEIDQDMYVSKLETMIENNTASVFDICHMLEPKINKLYQYMIDFDNNYFENSKSLCTISFKDIFCDYFQRFIEFVQVFD
ncbi:putative orfan [Tupanvirus soda lake]|uniref:Orfan n=2 Tax=Tupanvirus TaxID=2094720 RepID=A0AC62ADA4_9VIRU|nr:putative orfan [Tupanvirus soda lake]QKU35719.1 putative orfan [Tupanvirus soda lake]